MSKRRLRPSRRKLRRLRPSLLTELLLKRNDGQSGTSSPFSDPILTDWKGGPLRGSSPSSEELLKQIPGVLLNALAALGTPKPFGCEFTFIHPKNKSHYKLIPELARISGLRFHEDDGAIEHPSPLFHSIEECLVYWHNLRLRVAQVGLVPRHKTLPNGGLHIRVDYPFKPGTANFAHHIKRLWIFYARNAKWLNRMNEPGDWENAKPLTHLEYTQIEKIPARSCFHILKQLPCKSVALNFEDKCVEFRHFNSPATLTELAFYLYHALRMMHPIGAPKWGSHVPSYFDDHMAITLTPDIWEGVLAEQVRLWEKEEAAKELDNPFYPF